VTLYAGSQEETCKMAISFSVRVAAEQCGLSERTIHTAIKKGSLQAMRVGRRVLIAPRDLENYLHGKTDKSSRAGAK
jgi:excisionase family DNA binding protein